VDVAGKWTNPDVPKGMEREPERTPRYINSAIYFAFGGSDFRGQERNAQRRPDGQNSYQSLLRGFSAVTAILTGFKPQIACAQKLIS
jgi:hypothetical protein